MSIDYSYIDRNLEAVRRRIRNAAIAVGRSPDEITLLAAVKYATPEEIIRLRQLGVRAVGENRVQQLLEHEASGCLDGLDVHMIGTLQTNKVKYLPHHVSAVHSIDSEKLACELDLRAKKAGVVIDALIEINIGKEENKSGSMPEEVEALFEKTASLSSLRLRGFMTMAPVCADKSDYRKFFAETYRLSLDIWRKKPHNIEGEPWLSMGMSDSFEEAILEGSNIVRVGRGLFLK